MAGELIPDSIIDVLIANQIVGRDSGKNVTREFLSGCIKVQNDRQYLLECDDVLFPYHIVIYVDGNSMARVFLVIEDGASVENRWVYKAHDGKFVDIKEAVWPNITDEEISQLLIKATSNKKYSPGFIRSSVHSSYRVSLNKDNTIKVHSGLSDESFGTELGEIKWRRWKFEFEPKIRF